MEENLEQSEILDSTPNSDSIDGENVEIFDSVQPIEIEEGMPEDVKEAIMRFNKRTSALREVANDMSNFESNELDESDDLEELGEEVSNSIDTIDIKEEDDSEEIGDLF